MNVLIDIILEVLAVLSVIILHHVDSYSCRAVTKHLQQSQDSDTDVTDYAQLKQRGRDISSILKQLLERSSSEISSEHQKSLAKLTIEPYNNNVTKTEWQGNEPLHWFDKNKKTIAPLAIIVTNLPEITKLQNRDKNKDKKYLIQNKGEITSLDSKQVIKENPQEILLDSDLRANINNDFTENSEPNTNRMIKEDDISDADFENLDNFSIDDVNLSKELNKQNNSLYVDLGWQSKEEIFDNLEPKDISKEETTFKKIVEIENKNVHDDVKSFTTESIDIFEDELADNNNTINEIFSEETISLDINEPTDATINGNQENLINLLLEDTDLKIIKENDKLENINNDISLNNDSKIILKLTDNNDDSLVVNEIVPNNKEGHRHHHKCRKHRRHDSRKTYNLSFQFNK
ncbi:hypothetical protein RR48_02269 [Papilio machaon]|uniref:Uncharacterized protein n=1 Tax=Papilio machaon TaxID=76193 RepID=A0A0N1II13_PAPMA|nr:hypothetical protein RR48_02269 [Papilio machaon]